MKISRYFLHGDADTDSTGLYYCGACDIFAEEDHFDCHANENWQRLERSVKKLQTSDLAHRPDDARSLASKWQHNGSVKLYELLCFRFPRTPISKKKRFEILRSDAYRCQICGKSANDGVKLEVDHKLAVARGGGNEDGNLWTLCFACNSGKRAREL
jgi:5-methylcytosine-specific restriction endonuclease McrA